MAVAERPETFVALRGGTRRFRSPAPVRGRGVDVDRLDCHACGADIDWRQAIEQICVDCPACGAVTTSLSPALPDPAGRGRRATTA